MIYEDYYREREKRRAQAKKAFPTLVNFCKPPVKKTPIRDRYKQLDLFQGALVEYCEGK